jgi:hypothetical protein
VCNDGDPCTLGDTCQAGTCSGTLDLTCAGNALQNAVLGAQFVGTRLQQRLARRIEKIQAKIDTAFTPDPQRAIRSFRTALRLLDAFTRRVERGTAHGRLDPVLAQELLGRASRMKSQASVLLSALQGYPP